MIRYLLFISCQLFFLSSFSQSAPITGKVMDQNYFPIPFAHISDLNLDFKTVADSAGNFIIHLNRSEISLKASAVGFQNQHNPTQSSLTELRDNSIAILSCVILVHQKQRHTEDMLRS